MQDAAMERLREEEPMSEQETFLRRLEERLGRVSGWLRARGGEGEAPGAGERHARLEAIRRELAKARHAVAEAARADLAHVRADLDDLRRDYDVPQHHTRLTHAEWEAFRRHLHTTVRLMPDLYVADSPTWDQSHEEYERSWADVEHAFESEGKEAAP